MNKAERHFLCLVLFLFGLGWVARLGALDHVTPLTSAELPLGTPRAESQMVTDSAQTLVTDSVPASKKKKEKKASKLTGPVAINTATLEQLCAIKGIGPALASRIIEYRTRKGRFRNARDLDKVPGIGEKKLKSICEWVIFD